LVYRDSFTCQGFLDFCRPSPQLPVLLFLDDKNTIEKREELEDGEED